LAADPIGLDGGVGLYGYVGANPVNEVDLEGLAGPYHPPVGIHFGCKSRDECNIIRGKMQIIMKMIDSHQGWDQHNPPPRGGSRHQKEIRDLWNAYANCQLLYSQKNCTVKECVDKLKDILKQPLQPYPFPIPPMPIPIIP